MKFLNKNIIDKNSLFISKKIFNKGLFIRNWNDGDWCFDFRYNKKKVSKLFLKHKFNNYNKMSHPLVVDSNDQVVWVPGLINANIYTYKTTNNNYIKISKEILN